MAQSNTRAAIASGTANAYPVQPNSKVMGAVPGGAIAAAQKNATVGPSTTIQLVAGRNFSVM